ncbi:MAG: Crp/Fnr family transcriptional regulator [Xanthomonadales bacterium]|nr:Crp/Fnr family transcriptional regulator [Xanthomonadales bacterium]
MWFVDPRKLAMVDHVDNALLRRIGAVTALKRSDRDLLDSLIGEAHRVPADKCMARRGSHPREVFIVLGGWAYTSWPVDSERRQILEIKLEGEMIGLTENARDGGWQSDVHTLTGCTIATFPRERLRRIFDSSARLTELLFLMLREERRELVNHLVLIGRHDAYSALANLILSLNWRLDMEGGKAELMEWPLTNRHVADLLGITPVHVSRTLGRMRADRVVDAGQRQLRILDRAHLEKAAGCRVRRQEPDQD